MKRIFMLLLWFSIQSVFSQTNRSYEIWDDEPAPNRGKDYSRTVSRGYPYDKDWEAHSYPIGNGYMGANIFGRTDTERIQITEKTMTVGAPYGNGGMTNFAEVFIEMDHYNVTKYKRTLNLNNAVSQVNYTYEGVGYSREYFASYPDNIIAIRLTATKKKKISCTVNAMIPYLRSKDEIAMSKGKTKAAYHKTGIAKAENDCIVLSGTVPSFNLNYEAQVKIINEGGELIANNDNGTNSIRIEKANSVTILIGAATNYELNNEVFLNKTTEKKLDPSISSHDKVVRTMQNASAKSYASLRNTHLKDYQALFSRVQLSFSDVVNAIPTKTLVANYQKQYNNKYLEELMYHFGRYLLIASSREKTLPSTLQGVWNQYHVAPWSGGYWHNINVQMNYWGAFNANLVETFTAFEKYFKAYMPMAKKTATKHVAAYYPDKLNADENENGWIVGTGANAYHISEPNLHSGPGTGGFTTKLFWDRYEFTQDTIYLRETTYPALLDLAKFYSKILIEDKDGNLLVKHSASPEQRNPDKSIIDTHGATYDQAFVWETYNDLLKSAQILKLENSFLDTIRYQIQKLDPILIGASGQIKEFREENFYGEIGDPKHRHISHLCPLYPGTLINSSKPEWLKAASYVLDQRGNQTTGWALAHRMNTRARIKEGDKAYEAYVKFLKERTEPNLWTVHPPFQIDGNLGSMAGVNEMLLQSHQGYIEVLPALPNAWKKGSFKGLLARGNFEISAQWEKNNLTSLVILSKKGTSCSIVFNENHNVKIMDQSGKEIVFVLEGNKIVFPTTAGTSYTFVIK